MRTGCWKVASAPPYCHASNGRPSRAAVVKYDQRQHGANWITRPATLRQRNELGRVGRCSSGFEMGLSVADNGRLLSLLRHRKAVNYRRTKALGR